MKDCWSPGWCRDQFQLTSFPQAEIRLFGVSYSYEGHWRERDLAAFIHGLIQPLEQVSTLDDFLALRAKHDVLIAGCYLDLAHRFNGSDRVDYDTFYHVAVAYRKSHPMSTVGFAVLSAVTLAHDLNLMCPSITVFSAFPVSFTAPARFARLEDSLFSWVTTVLLELAIVTELREPDLTAMMTPKPLPDTSFRPESTLPIPPAPSPIPAPTAASPARFAVLFVPLTRASGPTLRRAERLVRAYRQLGFSFNGVFKLRYIDSLALPAQLRAWRVVPAVEQGVVVVDTTNTMSPTFHVLADASHAQRDRIVLDGLVSHTVPRLTFEAIRSFLFDVAAGRVAPVLRSAPPVVLLHGARVPIQRRVNATLTDYLRALQPRDVVVLVHAPWCGFCQPVRAIFGATLSSMLPEVLVMVVNVEVTDLGAALDPRVTSLPTIAFLPEADDQSPIILDSNHRTLEDLQAFVETHQTRLVAQPRNEQDNH